MTKGQLNPAKRPEVRAKLSQIALKRYGWEDRGRPACNSLYHNYRRNASFRNLEFALTSEEFNKLTSKDCFYCGVEPKQIVFTQVIYRLLTGYTQGLHLSMSIISIYVNAGIIIFFP